MQGEGGAKQRSLAQSKELQPDLNVLRGVFPMGVRDSPLSLPAMDFLLLPCVQVSTATRRLIRKYKCDTPIRLAEQNSQR